MNSLRSKIFAVGILIAVFVVSLWMNNIVIAVVAGVHLLALYIDYVIKKGLKFQHVIIGLCFVVVALCLWTHLWLIALMFLFISLNVAEPPEN